MKKKKNISDKALELINQQQLKPIPKWEFVVKNWGLWLGFIVSLGLLVLGVGISWFGLVDNIITPYLWVFIALFFLGTAFLLFEKTKKAYRFQKWQVISLILIVGLITGGIIFRVGLASRIDRNLESRSNFYRQMVPMRLVVWNNPKQGYLSGEILSLNSANNFQIKDFNNKVWTISGQNPLIRGRVQMIVGEEIKLIGSQTGVNSFFVDEVRPWSGKGQNMMKEN
ncbi:hypothetical protein KBC75_04035 [Candidatus Shapirobacteria bacterium]|nr:hypothetical protein [Candidatus Shapirobacteria bacterium]